MRSDSAITPAPQSASLIEPEDTALQKLPGSVAVLANGDTLRFIIGRELAPEQARDYRIDLYTRNATPYARITKTIVGQDGKSLDSPIARTRLVPIDSTQYVVTEGLCSVNEANDPFVFGIVRPVGDSVQWQASHAWRFDVRTETIREISASGVKCARIVIDD